MWVDRTGLIISLVRPQHRGRVAALGPQRNLGRGGHKHEPGLAVLARQQHPPECQLEELVGRSAFDAVQSRNHFQLHSRRRH